MIVIPRKKNESIVIGDDIILTVIEVRGDKVRLGVELPEGGTVHRARGVRGDPPSGAEGTHWDAIDRKGSHRRECPRSAEMS